MYGASTQDLRASAAQLRTEAEQLNSSSAALTRDLGALTWLGTLAVRFSDVCNSHHHSQMMVTAAFLNENADKLFRHAEQQDRASEGSSGLPRVVHPPSMGRGFPGGPPLLGGAGRPEPLPTEPRPFVPHGTDPLPGIPPWFSDPVEPVPFRPDHHTDPGFDRITDPKLPFDPKHDPIVAVPVMPTPPLRPNPHDQNRP